MMNYFKYLLSVVCLILVISACDTVDYGDLNKQTDIVTEANTQSLLAASMNYALRYSGASQTLYVQYQSEVVYTSGQLYSANPTSWLGYYTYTLNNFKTVRQALSQEKIDPINLTFGAPVNQIGVSELMSALVWKRLTDSYGPVPYKEAISDSTITPAYTDQETIYKDLVSRVKKARDMLDDGLAGPTGDVVYGGDVTKWKKFANSFLMSLSMQMSKAAPDYAKGVFTAALNDPNGVIETVDDEFWYLYQNNPGATNPLSTLRGADYQMSLPMTAALSGESSTTTYNSKPVINYSNTMYDGRLNIYANDPSLDGRPYGRKSLSAENTPAGLTDTYTSLSPSIIGATAPLHYMTAAYTYLNRAEAAMLGWTSEDAETMFKNGIEMSFKTVDAHWDDGSASSGNLQNDGSAYAVDRLDDAPMDQLVGEEKWVALFPMGYQAWSEWRRTGYPDLVPAIDATNSGSIPTRVLYPSNEPGTNIDAYNKGVSQLSPAEDTNTAKFWWEMGGN